MRRSGYAAAALVTVLLVLAVGLAELFSLRFERGDIYPAYSSLRNDALGTAVVHEALSAVDIAVERNRAPFVQLAASNLAGVTVLYLGASPFLLSGITEEDAFEDIATSGGRLVIAMLPVEERPPQEFLNGPTTRRATPDPEEDPTEKAPPRSGLTRWGIQLSFEPLPSEVEKQPRVHAVTADDGAEAASTWHSALYFRSHDSGWRTLYEREDGRAVIIERDFGRGSIVLATDSFFLSNQAMREERRPRLLRSVLGNPRLVIFDETHLGIAERPGVATLARRYHLHGLLVGLVVLAVLHVWRGAVPFLPPVADRGADDDALISGKDASAGLIHLVRRSLPPSDLLNTCLQEWRRTSAHGRPDLAPLIATCEAMAATASDDKRASRTIAQTYGHITEALDPRRRPSGS